METLIVKIDGVGINATSIASKKEEDGIHELAIAGGIPGNTEQERIKWATKAREICVKAVAATPKKTGGKKG